MGVSGAGKSAVGERLSNDLGWPFVDGDDLHPAANVRKMASGVPLTDEDRAPWLQRVRDVILKYSRSGRSAIIACSALKQAYRDFLLAGLSDARLVYLQVTPPVAKRRLRERQGHFFDPSLLESQFDTLEEPIDGLLVNADRPVAEVVDTVLSEVQRYE